MENQNAGWDDYEYTKRDSISPIANDYSANPFSEYLNNSQKKWVPQFNCCISKAGEDYEYYDAQPLPYSACLEEPTGNRRPPTVVDSSSDSVHLSRKMEETDMSESSSLCSSDATDDATSFSTSLQYDTLPRKAFDIDSGNISPIEAEWCV